MKLFIKSIEESTVTPGVFNAKCAEVTEHDLVGKLVYAKFTKTKNEGFEFEVDDKRITQVKTKNKRTIWVLK